MRVFTFLTMLLVTSGVEVARNKKPPNVVIMYMDDMGWGDIGANGEN